MRKTRLLAAIVLSVAIGAPRFTTVNVLEPEFMKGFAALLASTPIDDVKTYMRWHLVHANANRQER